MRGWEAGSSEGEVGEDPAEEDESECGDQRLEAVDLFKIAGGWQSGRRGAFDAVAAVLWG